MKAYLIALIILSAGLALYKFLVMLKLHTNYKWGKEWVQGHWGQPFNPYKDQYYRAVFAFVAWCLAIIILTYFVLNHAENN